MNLKEGDVVIYENGAKRCVLGVCGKVIHLSCTSDDIEYGYSTTKEKLEEQGAVKEERKPPKNGSYLRCWDGDKDCCCVRVATGEWVRNNGLRAQVYIDGNYTGERTWFKNFEVIKEAD